MDTIVCFGEALIDFLAEPSSGRDRPRAFLQHAGGAPANVAVALARLGAHVEFIGALGTDFFGDFLLASLGDSGVGTRHVQRTDGAPTALAFVALDADGERSFSFHRPPAADLLFDVDALAVDAFSAARALHVCSNSLTEEVIAQATFACMQRARAGGALVSFDMNLRPSLWPRHLDPAPRIWNALARADVIKLSAEELAFLAAPLGGEGRALDEIWRGVADLVVVTDGARPLRWFTPPRHGTLDTLPTEPVDSTGAGDAFSAGLLFGLARRRIDKAGLPTFVADRAALSDALRFAAACGAIAVSRRGAFAAMPSRADVDALLARHAPVQPVKAAR